MDLMSRGDVNSILEPPGPPDWPTCRDVEAVRGAIANCLTHRVAAVEGAHANYVKEQLAAVKVVKMRSASLIVRESRPSLRLVQAMLKRWSLSYV
jgi:hypothetical protein